MLGLEVGCEDLREEVEVGVHLGQRREAAQVHVFRQRVRRALTLQQRSHLVKVTQTCQSSKVNMLIISATCTCIIKEKT